MFNGTCNGVNLQNKPIEFRYKRVCYTSCWGGLGAYDAFKAIDELNPGDEIDYKTWQKLIYAGKLLAKHYNWFEHIDPANEKFCKPAMKWNPDTEEYELDTGWAGGYKIWNPETNQYENADSDIFKFDNVFDSIKNKIMDDSIYCNRIKTSNVVIYTGLELNNYEKRNRPDGCSYIYKKGIYSTVRFDNNIKYKCWVTHDHNSESLLMSDTLTILYVEYDDGRLKKVVNIQDSDNPILPAFMVEHTVNDKKELIEKVLGYCKIHGTDKDINEVYKMIIDNK